MRIFRDLVLIIALFIPFGAQAFDIEAMSKAERAALHQEIRNYILENPEILVEAMTVLEERDRNSQIRRDTALFHELKEPLWNDGISFTGGNPHGDVTIVEFVDYRCGYCRKAHSEVAELIETDGNIRLIVKEYPILGPDSEASSKAAIATLQLFGREAYADLYEELITFKGPINEQSVRQLSERVDLDADQILERMNSAEVANHIQAMHDLGTKLEVTGTPTFVVGQTILRGYLPPESMRQIVQESRTMAN
ncbi:MAG: DsbA family protein [Rhodobacteraceae bacterium]|nr:DsbA family protein [Paracoccaceae bacterium]